MDVLCTKARDSYISTYNSFTLSLKMAAGALKVILNSVTRSKYFIHFLLNFHCVYLDF